MKNNKEIKEAKLFIRNLFKNIPMKKIKFSYNWNKKLNNFFYTTIRLPNDYHKVNENYEIWLKDKKHHIAKIQNIKHLMIHELTEVNCYLDTGYSKEATIQLIKNMYPKYDFETKPIALILLKYVSKE